MQAFFHLYTLLGSLSLKVGPIKEVSPLESRLSLSIKKGVTIGEEQQEWRPQVAWRVGDNFVPGQCSAMAAGYLKGLRPPRLWSRRPSSFILTTSETCGKEETGVRLEPRIC